MPPIALYATILAASVIAVGILLAGAGLLLLGLSYRRYVRRICAVPLMESFVEREKVEVERGERGTWWGKRKAEMGEEVRGLGTRR